MAILLKAFKKNHFHKNGSSNNTVKCTFSAWLDVILRSVFSLKCFCENIRCLAKFKEHFKKFGKSLVDLSGEILYR